MLVLERHVGESIAVTTSQGPATITVKLLGTRGNRASIGLDAPPDVKILRSELLEENPNEERE